MSARRTLLASALALPVAGALPARAAGADATLVALAAELRAIEAAYEAAVENADDHTLTLHARATGDRLEATVARMAEIPAAGLLGIAAKAGRLCRSLHPQAAGLMCCEDALVASLADDLARLVPQAVGDAA